MPSPRNGADCPGQRLSGPKPPANMRVLGIPASSPCVPCQDSPMKIDRPARPSNRAATPIRGTYDPGHEGYGAWRRRLVAVAIACPKRAQVRHSPRLSGDCLAGPTWPQQGKVPPEFGYVRLVGGKGPCTYPGVTRTGFARRTPRRRVDAGPLHAQHVHRYALYVVMLEWSTRASALGSIRCMCGTWATGRALRISLPAGWHR